VEHFVIIQFIKFYEVQELNYTLHKFNTIYSFYENQTSCQNINYGIPEHCDKLKVFT